MFAYCGNEPVLKVDSEGKLPIEKNISDRVAVRDGSSTFTTILIPGRPWSDLQWGYSWSAYERNTPWYFKHAVLDISIFSISTDGVSLINASFSLIEQGKKWNRGELSLFDIGILGAELGFENYTFSGTAMATIWKPGIEFDCNWFTVSIDANIGSYGGEFSLGKNGITFGSSAIFGLSLSIGF